MSLSEQVKRERVKMNYMSKVGPLDKGGDFRKSLKGGPVWSGIGATPTLKPPPLLWIIMLTMESKAKIE